MATIILSTSYTKTLHDVQVQVQVQVYTHTRKWVKYTQNNYL